MTPSAPMKKSRTKSRVYKKSRKGSKKAAARRQYARGRSSMLKRRKRGTRNAGSSVGDRVQGGITTKRMYPKHVRATLKRLDQQQTRCTWVAYDRLACNTGYQQVQTYSAGWGGSLPTVDPGNAILNDLRKIWFEYTGAAAGNQTRGIILDNIRQELEISCASDNVANLTIYTWVARRDSNVFPADAWNNGLTNVNLKASGPAASTAPTREWIGMTPYASTPFCENFKIIGTKSVTLNPGKTYKHVSVFNIKKRYDAKLFDNSCLIKKGITHGVMIVIKGNLVNEFGQATAAEVMNGPAAVLISQKHTAIFKVDTTENRDTTMTFVNMANPTGMAQPTGVNPTTGAIDTDMRGAV